MVLSWDEHTGCEGLGSTCTHKCTKFFTGHALPTSEFLDSSKKQMNIVSTRSIKG